MGRVSRLRLLLPLGGVVLFLLFPARAAAGAASGLRLAAGVLIPSLFPVGVLAGALVRLAPEGAAGPWPGRVFQALFGGSEAGAAPLVLGLLGGYPLGANLVCSLYREGRLSEAEARRLSGLCNNAGPAFLLGVVGTVLGELRLGAALAGIQLLSVLLTGLLLREPWPVIQAAPKQGGKVPGPGDALLSSLRDTALSMVFLTGTVVFFQAGLACLEALLPLASLPPFPRALLAGSLELSGGVNALRGLSARTAFPAASLLIGWGGCCVHLQAAGALRAAKLPIGPYLRSKLLQGAICLILGALFALFISVR